MMVPGFGIGELIVSFLVIVFSVALPLGVLFLLYKIYTKLSNIEKLLKKD